jgi:hypothetical protein
MVLLTASQVIDAFGGTSSFALVCRASPSSVSEWRKSGLPARRFETIRRLAAERGMRVEPSAFTFHQSVPWAE